MKRLAIMFCLIMPCILRADPWHSAKSTNWGNSVNSFVISVNTTTAVQIVDPTYSIQSAGIDIFSVAAAANYVYIGSTTVSLASIGYPIAASTTYRLDGTYTGGAYAIGTSGQSTSTVRVIYYLKSDWAR